jgi:hypothetical protein
MRQADHSEVLNKKFGLLHVLQYHGKDARSNSLFLCKCDCGNSTLASFTHLKHGRRTSCGCYKPGGLSHGMRRTPEYITWCDMIKRCYNQKVDKYRFYGGRGITVCDDWRNSFQAFFEDMGYRPEGMTLDRINPNGNYCKENCRWADDRTQIVNRRGQVTYEFEGRQLTLPEIAKATGINYRTLRNRMFRTGLSLASAIAHGYGEITPQGMTRLKDAVIASNKRRGTTG